MSPISRLAYAAAIAAALLIGTGGAGLRAEALNAEQEKPTGQGFSFRTSVELINVTATVTDGQGRFVSGLTADDFEMFCIDEARIESGKRTLLVTTDGEVTRMESPLHFRTRPRALRVLVPNGKEPG